MTILARQSLQEHLEEVARKSSTPGGGAVAAVTAAEACALLSMVANFTKADMSDLLLRTEVSRARLLELADEDSTAFASVMAAYKGDGDLENALRRAAQVPVNTIEICSSHIADLSLLAEQGNRNLITDVAIAACLLRAALESCRFNVLVNVRSMTGDTATFTQAISGINTDVKHCNQVSETILQELA